MDFSKRNFYTKWPVIKGGKLKKSKETSAIYLEDCEENWFH